MSVQTVSSFSAGALPKNSHGDLVVVFGVNTALAGISKNTMQFFSDGFDEGCLNIFGFKIACAELQEHFDRNCLFLFNLKMVRPFCGFQLQGSLRDVSIGKGLHSNLLFFRFQRQLTLYFKIIYMGVFIFFRLQDGLYGSMWHSKRTNVTSSCGILLQDNLCGTSTDFRW